MVPEQHNAVARLLKGSWLAPLIFFLGASLLYSLNLYRVPHADELYHILAARGILETGAPRIEQGTYERVYLFTLLLSKLFSQFGESLAVARTPSLLAIAAVASLLFIWLRRTASLTAATIGTSLFALSPFATDIALFTRFYGIQTLAFFVAAMLIYHATECGLKKSIFYLFLATLFLLIATYLQVNTLIGIAALGLWYIMHTIKPYLSPFNTRALKIFLCLTFLALFAATIAYRSGLLENIWVMYRTVPFFNQVHANQFWYYYAEYLKNYPTLWPIVVIVSLSGATLHPKPVVFASVVFGTSFLLSSFGASKSLRYVIYIQPFIFILFGIGLASIAKPLLGWIKGLSDDLAEILPLNNKLSAVGATAIIFGAILFLVVSNPGFARTAAILSNFPPRANWMAAHDKIELSFRRVEIIVTQAELEMLYYYGQYDVLYSPSRLGENPGAEDFDADFRTGKPIVASYKAMTRIFDCYQTGVFVTTAGRWRHPSYMQNDVANLIETNATPIALPESSQIMAFEWTKNKSSPKPNSCGELPVFNIPQES